MIRTKFFRMYLVDDDQPWWYNRWVCRWGRKPKPRYTEKGVVHGDHPHELRFEWCLFSRWCGFRLGLQVGAEDGRGVTISLGFPWLFYLYVTHSVGSWFTDRVLPKSRTEADGGGWPIDRRLSISSFEWSLHYSLWTHPWDGGFGDHGRTKIGKWRDGIVSINPLDLLGRMKCTTEIVEPEREVLILMPEGDYPALLKVERRTWMRKLWPWWPLRRERTTRDITCELGVPFSGKGENAWDCGEDGLYGTGFEVDSDEAAKALYAASVLQTRKERGDPRKWPVSSEERNARIAALRSEEKCVGLESREGTSE